MRSMPEAPLSAEALNVNNKEMMNKEAKQRMSREWG
jgi:hypothetical protein